MDTNSAVSTDPTLSGGEYDNDANSNHQLFGEDVMLTPRLNSHLPPPIKNARTNNDKNKSVRSQSPLPPPRNHNHNNHNNHNNHHIGRNNHNNHTDPAFAALKVQTDPQSSLNLLPAQSPLGSDDDFLHPRGVRLNSLDTLVMNQSVIKSRLLEASSDSENLDHLIAIEHSKSQRSQLSRSSARTRSRTRSKRRQKERARERERERERERQRRRQQKRERERERERDREDLSVHDSDFDISFHDSDNVIDPNTHIEYETDGDDDENGEGDGDGDEGHSSDGSSDNFEDQLIALINGSSGARKGWVLAKELQRFDAIIYDMLELTMKPKVLQRLANDLKLWQNKSLVMICGGDGSIAWGASLVDKALALIKSDVPLPFPPSCSLPLGTGNDLSRCLGWGNLEPNHTNVLEAVADVQFCAKITKRWSDLDRWRVTFTFDHITEKASLIQSYNCNNNNNDHSDHNTNNNIGPELDSMNTSFIGANLNVVDAQTRSPSGSPLMAARIGFNGSPLSTNGNALPTYLLPPPKQFYIQQNPQSAIYRHMHTFDPPLPSTFLCYLSLGYDALVAHKFERERRAYPERFNNQFKNQIMYVKHGFTEFFKPSAPLNGNVILRINEKEVTMPESCRSLKLVNINSAMNGLFFWGSGKSVSGEYQESTHPRLDDGKIELMATRGVHDMLQYRVNVAHAHRIAQPNDVTITISHTAVALQIDGEAWIVDPGCTLRIQFHDKLPIVIGYNNPRGVQSWLQASLNDAHIVRAKTSFRERVRRRYKEKHPDINTEDENEANNNSNNSNANANKNKNAQNGAPAAEKIELIKNADEDTVDRAEDRSASSQSGFDVADPRPSTMTNAENAKTESQVFSFASLFQMGMNANSSIFSGIIGAAIPEEEKATDVEMREMTAGSTANVNTTTALRNPDYSHAKDEMEERSLQSHLAQKPDSVEELSPELSISTPDPDGMPDTTLGYYDSRGTISIEEITDILSIGSSSEERSRDHADHGDGDGSANRVKRKHATEERKADPNQSIDGIDAPVDESLKREESLHMDLDSGVIKDYLKEHPPQKNEDTNILQSSIFTDPNKNLSLDNFAWWKITRAQNEGHSIDAETAKDALKSPSVSPEHRLSRKAQSFSVLPSMQKHF